MSAPWEQRLLSAWYQGSTWLWLLRPLEFLFRFLAALRRWSYSTGLRDRYRAEVPVVVVGNITLGGTGKTPVVIALVEALAAQGHRVGVVSRGYGADAGTYPLAVTADTTAAQCGDEALLLHLRTGCPVVVDPDRARAARYLEANYDVDLLISDDGLQHYALDRDFEIVLIDQDLGLGNGFCLPAGPLREPPSRLKTVDQVLYRGGPDRDRGVSYTVQGLVNLVSRDEARLGGDAVGPEVHALAGIGQPEQFFSTLEQAGLVLERHVFSDHHAYVESDFAGLADKPVIMTEKDAVKCVAFARPAFWYLKISARLPDKLIQRISELAAS